MHFIIKPSSFILSVSSSIPQRTSEYNSLPELFPIWISRAGFQSDIFSEYELCVDEDLSGLSVDRRRRIFHCF